MSTLNVSNITDGTTTVGTSYVVNGSAKAWVNFNGTGTIAARDSLNVSSLTDNGTGDYTVNTTEAMLNTDGAVTTSAHNGALPGGRGYSLDASFVTTSSLRLASYLPNTLALIDADVLQASAHGDLA